MSSKFSTSRADVDRDIGPASHTARLHISFALAMFLFVTVFELRADAGPHNTKWSSPSQKFFQPTSPSWTSHVDFLLSQYVNLR